MRYGLPGYRNLAPVDWLTTTDQALLELTKGAIFHDGLDELRPMQATFAYYPDQIWRYRLAAQWARIGEMVAFVGRTAEVGDEIGSRLTATLLVRDLMRLAFLMERTVRALLKVVRHRVFAAGVRGRAGSAPGARARRPFV